MRLFVMVSMPAFVSPRPTGAGYVGRREGVRLVEQRTVCAVRRSCLEVSKGSGDDAGAQIAS